MRDIIEEYAEKRAQMAVAKAEREIVIKLSCKGMSIEEIASILEITEAHVKELADKKSA